jgi:hypothetical protein
MQVVSKPQCRQVKGWTRVEADYRFLRPTQLTEGPRLIGIGTARRDHSVRASRFYLRHKGPAVRQDVAQVAEQRRGGVALAVQPGLAVPFGFVRGVVARLPTPVLGRGPVVRAVLAQHALLAGQALIRACRPR